MRKDSAAQKRFARKVRAAMRRLSRQENRAEHIPAGIVVIRGRMPMAIIERAIVDALKERGK